MKIAVEKVTDRLGGLVLGSYRTLYKCLCVYGHRENYLAESSEFVKEISGDQSVVVTHPKNSRTVIVVKKKWFEQFILTVMGAISDWYVAGEVKLFE